MINDILRLNISVYWSENDFNVLSKKLCSNETKTSFKKGAFIIPFTGNIFNDTLLTSIILDYNQTHELENNNTIGNKAYLLLEEINKKARKLNNVKIAQHFGKAVRYSWPSYLQIAEAGGFLTYEYLFDNETENKLNNKDYNVYIWPYLPDPATLEDQLLTLTNPEIIKSIRRFVKNGGGYLGTCYGAYAASSGFINPFSLYSLKYAYNYDYQKNIPSASLSISDTLMMIYPDVLRKNYIVEIKTVKPNHPVFFGVNKTMDDFLKSPLFFWIGKNTQTIAVFNDVKSVSRNPEQEIRKLTKKIVTGRPAWVSSTFGKGKIVLYDSHPDFVNNITPLFHDREKWDGDRFYGRRIVHNSLYYVTSEENKTVDTTVYYNDSFINNIVFHTSNLKIQNKSSIIFNQTLVNIKYLAENITCFENILKTLKNTSFLKDSRFFNYGLWYCYFLQDYINKSVENMKKIDRVTLMLNCINISTDEKTKYLKEEVNQRINNSKRILSRVIEKTGVLQNKKLSKYGNLFYEIRFFLNRKNIFEYFSTVLRYIPQIYFETLKFLRHIWYLYEASISFKDILFFT